MKLKQIIIILITIIFSIWLIYNHQNKYKVITEWDENYIEIKYLNNVYLYLNKFLSFWNQWFSTAIFEHTLPIDINNSITLWKNQWLNDDKNKQYIIDFFKLYWERWNIYQIILDYIILEPTVNKQTSDKYLYILENFLIKEKNYDINNIYYKEIYNLLNPILCENSFPLNPNLNNFYNLYGMELYKEKEYKKSACLLLLSWYENKMDSWKTLVLSWYKDYLINNIKDDEYIKNINMYEENIYIISSNLKWLIADNENIKVHRNTTKNNSIILINQVYLNTLNSLRKNILDIKNKTNENIELNK